MSRRPAYQPPPPEARRFEWVDVGETAVCLWALTAGEMNQVFLWAKRPSIDPRGGIEESAVSAGLIALSCHDGEPDDPEAARTFDDMAPVFSIPFSDYQILSAAAQRVNGLGTVAEEETRDFFGPEGEPRSSGSASSASRSSTAYPNSFPRPSRTIPWSEA